MCGVGFSHASICAFVLILTATIVTGRNCFYDMTCTANASCSTSTADRPGRLTNGTSEEQQLLYYLMQGYEKSVRPVKQASTIVNVSLGITLTQILDVDERNQALTVQVWLDQKWRDQNLVWNPDDFFGITHLQIPCDLLWLPDIVLYNSMDDYTNEYMRSLTIVEPDGSVFWPPIVRFHVSCIINITFFPFDDQICHMKLGSWLYDGGQLDVIPFDGRPQGAIDTSNFVLNGEWDLVDVRAVKNTIVYDSVPVPFHDITFYIHIRRKTLYYTFNIIIPCVFLSSLTMIGFRLPADSGEKITLGLTILLAYSVFTLLIAESMPPTSDAIPLIGIYLTLIMGMTAASAVVTIIVLEIHHIAFKKQHRPPRWIRFIMIDLILCELCGKKRHKAEERVKQAKKRMLASAGELERLLELATAFDIADKNDERYASMDIEAYRDRCENGGVSDRNENGLGINEAVENWIERSKAQYRRPALCTTVEHEIVRNLKGLLQRQERQEVESRIVEEWQKLAVGLDRIMFYLYIVLQILGGLIILVWAPSLKNDSIQAVPIDMKVKPPELVNNTLAFNNTVSNGVP